MISYYFPLFILASVFLIVGIEYLKRTLSLPVLLTRKAAHMGGALIAFLSPLFLNQKEIIIISILFAVALYFTRRTSFFSSIHAVNRTTLGEVFLPLGVLLCALFFLPEETSAFQFGVLVMGISDGLAGLIGERFGTHRIQLFNSKKTIEGTGVFFITCLILTFFFIPGIDYRLLMIPLILTTMEFFLEYGLDNLMLPIAASSLIRFLN